MGYKVTAAVVVMAPGEKSSDLGDSNNGPRYFYEGAVIPDGYNDERCKELVDEGMLEAVSSTDAAAADEPEGPPAKSASKADWEAYARTQGATDADLEGATKDDLIAKYGG